MVELKSKHTHDIGGTITFLRAPVLMDQTIPSQKVQIQALQVDTRHSDVVQTVAENLLAFEGHFFAPNNIENSVTALLDPVIFDSNDELSPTCECPFGLAFAEG